MAALIRPAGPQTECGRIAALLTAIEPVPVSIDELMEGEDRHLSGALRRRFVVLDARNYVVGYALAVHYLSRGRVSFTSV